jgi:hypothetical protein
MIQLILLMNYICISQEKYTFLWFLFFNFISTEDTTFGGNILFFSFIDEFQALRNFNFFQLKINYSIQPRRSKYFTTNIAEVYELSGWLYFEVKIKCVFLIYCTYYDIGFIT